MFKGFGFDPSAADTLTWTSWNPWFLIEAIIAIL